MALYRRPGNGSRIAVLGAGAFGIGMCVALGMGQHEVRMLLTSSSTHNLAIARIRNVLVSICNRAYLDICHDLDVYSLTTGNCGKLISQWTCL